VKMLGLRRDMRTQCSDSSSGCAMRNASQVARTTFKRIFLYMLPKLDKILV